MGCGSSSESQTVAEQNNRPTPQQRKNSHPQSGGTGEVQENTARVSENGRPASQSREGTPNGTETQLTVNTEPAETQDKMEPAEGNDSCTKVDFPCLYGKGNSKWPIRCFAALDTKYNVNARYGGCAGLLQISNAYGAEGSNTTCEVFLFRSGFDSNHMSVKSVGKCHEGHFGADNGFVTDEVGHLVPECMFGSNHVSFLCNNARYGRIDHGILVEGERDGATSLPLNVNGAKTEHGAGATIILCGGWDSGMNEAKFVSAVYIIRSGHKGNCCQALLMKGEDKWKFSASKTGILTASGPGKTLFSIYHNRKSLLDLARDGVKGQSRSFQTQAIDGREPTEMLPGADHLNCTMLVLCSNTSGVEDASCAALYMLTLTEGKVDCKLVAEMVGSTYSESSGDQWTFEVSNGCVFATGPSGPCRYAFISNLPSNGTSSAAQTSCLATGEDEPIRGAVRITDKAIKGWVSKPSCVLVKDNERVLCKLSPNQLTGAGERYTFNKVWTEEEKTVGLHLVRAFATRNHVKDGTEVEIELEGSPRHLICQPKGVVYAVNSCGPAYQALSDIVYTSEFTKFANYSYKNTYGAKSLALGGMKQHGSIPQILSGGHDGFMFVTCRATGVEPVDEQKIRYDLGGLPNGKMTLRFHCVPASPGRITCNGKNITDQIKAAMEKTKEVRDGTNMYSADVPVSVRDGVLRLHMHDQFISGFALLGQDYKEKKKTKEELKKEAEEKQKMSDEVEPLTRSLTRKERKIVGWSPNLLINASGELGSMSHWNISGSWNVQGGGYQTEKAFVTSHMACVKYQEVDLTEHFPKDYLDTAPEIQASEWYREGCCGGGFYRFKATLLNNGGDTMATCDSGKKGSLYTDDKRWMQATHTFSGYGSGVRRVGVESYGKDDKFWGGSYGTIISNAVVRVKRETKPVDDDAFVDIIRTEEEQQAYAAVRERLVSRVLSDNQELLKELVSEQVVPLIDTTIEKQADVAPKKPRRRKKREIRVFVSSTFRDFTKEKEQLIKKTFREINGLCADRGVFFTYVDLRWGITEEQTNHGQTIAICLQEIARCRPYFICMLGERFGWCQKDEENKDKTLDQSFDYAVQNFPKDLAWVDEHRYNTSVTQLEILHGVLNDLDNRKDRSFFYLRKPVVKEAWPEDDFKRMSAESEWHGQKQHALRDRITSLRELNTRSYDMPLEVCDLIKTDLEWCVDQDFPKGTELSPLEREREAHVAFADARRRVYIGRQEYFNKIDKFMGQPRKTPLVILGESGSGKSALVANWVGKLEEREPNTFVFVHFIGSSAESASYIKLLRRLFEEIKNHFGFSLAVPASDTNLVRDLPTWLKMAGTQSLCVFVFDALNQLDDGSGEEGAEHDLLWIPRELPSGVNILLSTLPGRAYEAVKATTWECMEVHPLKPEEKLQIVTGYLSDIYGKTLSEEQKTMIVEASQTNNALYLKALMDEVRVFGSFRNLTPKIQEYLAAGSPGELFAKILERLEGDFERGQQNRPDLVKETTMAIWCSHRGMAEAELLELLQIPSAVWSPFYLSLVENLVNRNGIVNFFHDHLRQAVESKYLPTNEDKTRGYKKLAQFFSERPLDDRVVDELPYLLAKAGQLDELRSTISDLEVFRRMVRTEDGKFDLIKSWTLLGDFAQVEAAYLKPLQELAAPQNDTEQGERTRLKQDLAEFFMDLGLLDAARSMFESLLSSLEDQYKDTDSAVLYNPFNQSRKLKCNHPTVIEILHRLGTVCQKQQQLTSASNYYHDAIARQNRVATPSQKLQLTEGLLGQATVLTSQGNMLEAKKFLIRAQELAIEVLGARHHFVAAIISKLGQLSYKQGRVEEALAYFLQDLSLTRNEVGTTHPRTAGTINEIALVYDDKNDPLARDLYEAALTILLDVYGMAHLDVAVTRYNLGAFYFATNSFSRARFQFTEAQKICEAFLGSDHAETVEAGQALKDVSAFIQ